MSAVKSLICRECQSEFEMQATHVCELCFGTREVRYDHAELERKVSPESIEAGPNSLWRYRDLLPLNDGAEPVTLGEGMTPLVRAERLGAELGLSTLYPKNETMTPTNSFKDRVVSVAVSWARANGFDTMACASTGNLANSVAAYSARAGMRCFVFIPADLEASKVLTTSVFAPNVVAVEGNYDEVNRLCSELADSYHWAFANINVRPFYAEGSKTLTYETAEQLGWRLPDEIVIPIASGCQFVKHNKAIQEMIELELVDPGPYPRLSGAQALNCSPVATAFKEGAPVRPVKPNTIAKSLAIGNPSDGKYVINIATGTGGGGGTGAQGQSVGSIQPPAATPGLISETPR